MHKDKKDKHGSASADRRVQGREHSQGKAKIESAKIKKAKRSRARGRLQGERMQGVECMKAGVKKGSRGRKCKEGRARREVQGRCASAEQIYEARYPHLPYRRRKETRSTGASESAYQRAESREKGLLG
jgi:hypothetical protein